jgi:hypothetical protein
MKSFTQLVFSILLIFLLSFTGKAQPNFPDAGEVYRDDVVARVDIFIHPDTLNWIYQNVESDIEWRADFVFNNGTVHDTIYEIGFRLRGNTSRQSAKKSFKVSFNTYESGRKYYGLEKMNLNGEHNDPTVARAKIGWDLYREAGIPAPRANHVQVFINNNYYGLYANVEHIDEEFADSRFDNQNGNLYKCLWPADLNYLGQNPDLYKFQAGDRRAYDLKTNKAADDYSDIAHFIDVLNNTPINELACELEKVFNVQDYLKVAAIDIFIANWDGYIFNKNNFYLYRNTKTGKFEYIPYDVDNTFGIDWFSINWATRDIYNWENPSEYRPLFERLMQVQKYRDWYSWHLDNIVEIMNPDTFFARLDQLRDQLYPHIIDDPYYPLDYGYSPQDFMNAYATGTGAHVPFGLKDYTTTRISSIDQQIQLNNIQPVIQYTDVDHNGPGTMLEVAATIIDDQENVAAELVFNFNFSGWESAAMTESGNHVFEAELAIPSGESTLQYQLKATDISGFTTLYPCDPVEINFGAGQSYQLYINELLASNQNGITDEYGQHEDWTEIYNAGDEPVWLGDKYLTDNLDNPDKWQFPDYTIQPQEFLIIWCDDDPNQGIFHTTFKLAKEGEELAIFDNEATGFAQIDAVVFGAQQSDISYGRSEDTGSEWIFFEDPTPGASNSTSSLINEPFVSAGFIAYPNPSDSDLLFFNKNVSFRIADITGRVLDEKSDVAFYVTEKLSPGIYFIKTTDGEVFKIIKQ